MLNRMGRAGLIVPSLLSLLGLSILLGLGTWQLVRKSEKDELIAKIEARRVHEPVSLESILNSGSLDGADYQRVSVTGVFLENKERFYYAPQPRLGPGFDIYQPLQYAPGQVVWINRGYLPERERANATSFAAPKGEVTITGTARLPAKPGAFTPDNDVKANVWYWRDLEGMHNSAFKGADAPQPVPVFVVAEPEKTLSDVDKAHVVDAHWPKRGISTLVIMNRHLEYALTWYGLALTLVGVYVAYAWTRLRRN